MSNWIPWFVGGVTVFQLGAYWLMRQQAKRIERLEHVIARLEQEAKG
jgi:hypothetical protein